MFGFNGKYCRFFTGYRCRSHFLRLPDNLNRLRHLDHRDFKGDRLSRKGCRDQLRAELCCIVVGEHTLCHGDLFGCAAFIGHKQRSARAGKRFIYDQRCSCRQRRDRDRCNRFFRDEYRKRNGRRFIIGNGNGPCPGRRAVEPFDRHIGQGDLFRIPVVKDQCQRKAVKIKFFRPQIFLLKRQFRCGQCCIAQIVPCRSTDEPIKG